MLRFSPSSFELFRASFEQIGSTTQTLAGIPKLLYDLLDRARADDRSIEIDSLLFGELMRASIQSADKNISQFEVMLAGAETLMARERAEALGLRHLLLASFAQLKGDFAVGDRGSEGLADLVDRATSSLGIVDRAERNEARFVEARYVVVSTGPGVIDYGNDYASLPDAVRAKQHIERRARLREWPGSLEIEHRSYVGMLVPANVESVSEVAIRILGD